MTRDIRDGASVTDGIHLFGFGEAGPEGTRLTLTFVRLHHFAQDHFVFDLVLS